MQTKRPSREKREQLNRILKELNRTVRKGVALSERQGFISHKQTFLHLLSHIQTLQDGLDAGKLNPSTASRLTER